VVAIDAKRKEDSNSDIQGWEVYIHGGRKATGLDAVKWAQKVEELGAGEILLTSMDGDGTKDGYDNELNYAISNNVDIPVIASGGAGNPVHILNAFKEGEADAALAASIFHFDEYSIKEVKEYLQKEGVVVRL
jgi:cyclase